MPRVPPCSDFWDSGAGADHPHLPRPGQPGWLGAGGCGRYRRGPGSPPHRFQLEEAQPSQRKGQSGQGGRRQAEKGCTGLDPRPKLLSSFLTAAAKVQPAGWRNSRELAASAAGREGEESLQGGGLGPGWGLSSPDSDSGFVSRPRAASLHRVQPSWQTRSSREVKKKGDSA